MAYKVLVIDDEPNIRSTIYDILTDEGYNVILAEDGESGYKKVQTEDLNCVLLDIMMPGKSGFDLLEVIHKEYPYLPVIMISGYGNIKIAVDSIKKGAFDFIEKPLSLEKLLTVIKNAIKFRELQLENQSLKSKIEKKLRFITKNTQMLGIINNINNIANNDSSVLITGENGTGKEIIAKLIHFNSNRRNNPFVSVNCAAIPETLIESELFGYEKGAFTGALKQQKGYFEQANNGTIFLDEIGDLSLAAQAKVLRVLQEKEIRRLGGNSNIYVNIRVIAATNKNLKDEIAKGNFREDLYYRLNIIPIHIPPLRERKEDIEILAKYFLEEFSEERKIKKELSKSAIDILENMEWKGNVRELKNFIERLVILCPNDIIEADDIIRYSSGEKIVKPYSNYLNMTLKKAKNEFEKMLIKERLEYYNMNITKTAESLDIERTYLYKKLNELGITKDKLVE